MWFTVKLQKVSQELPSLKTHQQYDFKGISALIVDDNVTNCKILEEQLIYWGIEAQHCFNAKDAMEFMLSNPVDLAIIDMNMPVVNGLELSKTMHNNVSLQSIKTILASSSVDEEINTESIQKLFDEHIRKPIHFEELNRLLIRLFISKEAAFNPIDNKHSLTKLVYDASNESTRILIVEDNLVNQKITQQILKKVGFVVKIVENGVLAVEAVQDKTFDIDCQMPVMDGYEATRTIRQLKDVEKNSITIIGLTAHALQGDREKCINAGMNDYLSKPFDAKLLIEKVLNYVYTRDS